VDYGRATRSAAVSKRFCFGVETSARLDTPARRSKEAPFPAAVFQASYGHWPHWQGMLVSFDRANRSRYERFGLVTAAKRENRVGAWPTQNQPLARCHPFEIACSRKPWFSGAAHRLGEPAQTDQLRFARDISCAQRRKLRRAKIRERSLNAAEELRSSTVRLIRRC